MPMDNAPITQRDLARELNLSLATISRCLRHDPALPPRTRARVLELAAQRGYRVPAGSAANRSTQPEVATLGMVLRPRTDEAIDIVEVWHRYLTGVSRAAQFHQVSLMMECVDPGEQSARFHEIAFQAGFMQRRQVQGLVLGKGLPVSVLEDLRRQWPVVVLGRSYPDVAIDCVYPEAQGALDRLVDRLVSLGHRRIGFVEPAYRDRWAPPRHAAYLQALATRELALDADARLAVAPEMRGECFDKLLRQTWGGITAWICASDWLGYRLQLALRERGLDAPKDVSITGFDDLGEPLPGLKRLTSVRTPVEDLGEAAVARLLDRIRHPQRPPTHVTLACPLVEGATVGPAPQRSDA